jgi:hypothetical protein
MHINFQSCKALFETPYTGTTVSGILDKEEQKETDFYLVESRRQFLLSVVPTTRHTAVTHKAAVSLSVNRLDQWHSTLFVRVPPDVICLQLCTLKVLGV